MRAGNSGRLDELNQPECTVLDQGDGLCGQETVPHMETDQENNGKKISHDKKERHKYRKGEGKNCHVMLAYEEVISVNS